MKYQVEWTSAAEDDLVRIWLQARDRQYLREALDQFEHDCGDHPLALGESRHGGFRVVFNGSLKIWMEVNEEAKLVTICSVERTKNLRE